MTQQDTAISCLDPHINLSAAHKQAAFKAGYGIPFITEEEKYKQARLEQQARERALELK